MLTAEEAEALAVSLAMPSKKALAENTSVRPAFRSGTRTSPLRGQAPRTDRRAEPQEDTRRNPGVRPGARPNARASEPRPSSERKTFVVRGGRAERQETVATAEGRPVARSTARVGERGSRVDAGQDMKRGATREPGRSSERSASHAPSRPAGRGAAGDAGRSGSEGHGRPQRKR